MNNFLSKLIHALGVKTEDEKKLETWKINKVEFDKKRRDENDRLSKMQLADEKIHAQLTLLKAEYDNAETANSKKILKTKMFPFLIDLKNMDKKIDACAKQFDLLGKLVAKADDILDAAERNLNDVMNQMINDFDDLQDDYRDAAALERALDKQIERTKSATIDDAAFENLFAELGFENPETTKTETVDPTAEVNTTPASAGTEAGVDTSKVDAEFEEYLKKTETN